MPVDTDGTPANPYVYSYCGSAKRYCQRFFHHTGAGSVEPRKPVHRLSQGCRAIFRHQHKKYTAIPDYVDLYDYLKYKYGLLKCGSGKAFLLLSDRPEKEDEFRCMMAGETYDSQHQDFHIASDNISQICQTNHAQYDYYQVYMSEMVVACIMENFSENMEERIDITATYAFIVILAMFQNTSIEKVNMRSPMLWPMTATFPTRRSWDSTAISERLSVSGKRTTISIGDTTGSPVYRGSLWQ